MPDEMKIWIEVTPHHRITIRVAEEFVDPESPTGMTAEGYDVLLDAATQLGTVENA